jgi:antitoxin (DNA-binding transcriptional repressor) of toxin-antitoxin stability system
MAINIELRPDEERALSERARGSGRDVTEYVHQILQRHIAIVSRALQEACGTTDSLTRKVVIDEQQGNVDDAKLQLSRLVEYALEGEDIIIVKGGAPILRLVPVHPENPPRPGGQWKGRVRMAEDFETLPDDIAAAFGCEPT